jgi:PBP1b-binding outer membrane lipoprotein LpoB
MFRKTATVAAVLGITLLLSGCIIAPAPYYHPHRVWVW